MQSQESGPDSRSIFPINVAHDTAIANERLSEALMLQARQLMDLAATLRSQSTSASTHEFSLIDPAIASPQIFCQPERQVEPDTRDRARTAYRSRRLRDTVFQEPGLFGEPGWDILLDLANARASGVRVSVSSACVGACVPSTTALRWLCILEKKGLVEREDDALDGRRTYVKLSRKALTKMEEFFRSSQLI
jgi:hypothetical protein